MSRQLRPWQIDILTNLISGSVVDNRGRRTVGNSPSINLSDYVTREELTNVVGGGLSGSGSTNAFVIWSGASSLTSSPFYYNSAQFSIKPTSDLNYRLGETSFNFLELYTATIKKDTSGALALTIATVQAHPILFTTGNTIRWRVADDGHIWPNAVDTYNLGTSVNRVNILHSRHINIETSDIHGVSYFWPSIQGGVGTFLQNDGAGNLTWTVPAGGLSGSGATNFIPMWSSASVLTNSPLEYDSGTSSIRPSFNFGINIGEPSRHYLAIYTASVIKNNTGAVSLTLATVQTDPIVITTGNTIRWLFQGDGHLRPNANNTYDIGTTSERVKRLHVMSTEINTVIYAWPSSQGSSDTILRNDGSGNLTWVARPTGTLTGSGSSGLLPKWTGASSLGDSSIEDTGSGAIRPTVNLGTNLGDNTKNFGGVYSASIIKDTSSAASLAIATVQAHPITFATTNSIRWQIDSSGHFWPNSTNSFDIGTTSNKPRTIYCATGFDGPGGSITSISASNISTGTLSDGRLSSNVPLKNAANTFTAAITMTSVNINFSAGFGIAASGTSVALASSNVECYTSSTLRAAFGTSVQLWLDGALRTIATFNDGAGHQVLYY